MPVSANRFLNKKLMSETVTMSDGNQQRSAVKIPNFGDVAFVEVCIDAQSTTGTLTTAGTLDAAIAGLSVYNKRGENLLQNIRGSDLLLLSRFRNQGRNYTVPTTSGSSQAEQFVIPLNIEAEDLEATVQVTIAPYSAMAASGATGGSITYSIVVWYYRQTASAVTEKIERITVSVGGAGTVSLHNSLPKGIVIKELYANLDEDDYDTSAAFQFSPDGSKELDELTINQLIGLDEVSLISGHVTDALRFYIQPFPCTDKTVFNAVATTSDTIQLYVVSEKPSKKM